MFQQVCALHTGVLTFLSRTPSSVQVVEGKVKLRQQLVASVGLSVVSVDGVHSQSLSSPCAERSVLKTRTQIDEIMRHHCSN